MSMLFSGKTSVPICSNVHPFFGGKFCVLFDGFFERTKNQLCVILVSIDLKK